MAKIRVLSKKEQKDLFKVAGRSTKYVLKISIMLDAGLRVTELIRLQLKHFDLMNNELEVVSLKKTPNSKQKIRRIPLTDRIKSALADYLPRLKNPKPTSFLFPTHSDRGHVSRIRVYRYIKAATHRKYSPHDLRHTFATDLVNSGADIRMAQYLLGHDKQKTTEIYLHIDQKDAHKAIERKSLKPVHVRLKDYIFKPRLKTIVLPVERDDFSGSIGRDKEIVKLHESMTYKTNLLVLGEQGCGKSHLLDRLEGDKILRLDDLKNVKKTLGNMLLFVSDKGKAELVQMMLKAADLQKVITRESSTRLTQMLLQVTEKKEFTLIIDDLTDVTKTGVRVLEKLKNHFHIIAAARQVRISYQSMISNFEKLELSGLGRVHSFELIDKLSVSMRQKIELYPLFRNHIFDQSNGNPLYIQEMIDRYRVKPYISTFEIRDTKHATARHDIDMTLTLCLFVAGLAILRYLGPEMGSNAGAYRLLGGAAMIVLYLFRPLMMISKRKLV